MTTHAGEPDEQNIQRPPGVDPTGMGWYIHSYRQLFLLFGSIMLGMLTAAISQTVVGTATPRIVADLDGVELYAWIFTSYMLASTVTVPIYGKLSDTYGRRPFFLSGIVVFLLGSVLCGIAQDMNQLILFRVIQGLGSGAIIPIAIAIVGDIFPPSERGKWQGLLIATFGIATVLGPTMGGWITDTWGWRWIFYVNLPIGIIAILASSATLPRYRKGSQNKLDIFGATLLVASAVPLLLAFSWAGIQYPWGSPQIIGLLAFAVVAITAFLMVEMRASEPILDPRLFTNSIYAVSIAATFMISVGMFSTIMYMPLFIQGVMGESATRSGMLLTPMMLGVSISSIIGGQVLARTGRYKGQAILGFVLALTGMILMSRLTPDATTFQVLRNLIVTGVGIGMMMQLFTIVSQNALPFRLLGSVTASVQFFRQIGGVMGVALFGSILLNRFQNQFNQLLTSNIEQEVGSEIINEFQNPLTLLSGSSGEESMIEQIPAPLLAIVQDSLAVAITDLFIFGAIAMGFGLLMTIFLKQVPLRTSNKDEDQKSSTEESGVPSPATQRQSKADPSRSVTS